MKKWIYEKKPSGFTERFEVVSCYMSHDKKLLILKRNKDDEQGGKWGVPGGKAEDGETIREALIREVYEETGIKLAEGSFAYLERLYVKYPKVDFIYHMFYAELGKKPRVKLSEEHEDYAWIDPGEVSKVDMVLGGQECVGLFCNLIIESGQIKKI